MQGIARGALSTGSTRKSPNAKWSSRAAS
jgi:hypothetical protein